MSVKPVAWLYESHGGYRAEIHRIRLGSYAVRGWDTETPLYSAPAPELAEALQRIVEDVKRYTAHLGAVGDCGLCESVKDSEKLLARITSK